MRKQMRKTLCLLPLASALLLSGCISLAPEYERPEAPVEQVWPQDEATKNAALLTEGLQKWSDFFTDERLTKLIELGLQNNRSLRSAFYSVEQARAQYNVSRADLLPSVAVQAEETAGRTPASTSGMGRDVTSHTYSANAAMASYELDLFGRIRNLNEQALQSYFQTQAAQRTAQMTVITEIAQTWLSLGASKDLLKLAQETYDSQSESLKLIQQSYELGASSMLEVQQAMQTVATAKAAAVQASRSVAQYRNALATLVGTKVPAELEPEGLKVDITKPRVSVASNIPSEVLLARPDIASAEAVLRSATPTSAWRVRRSSRALRSRDRPDPFRENSTSSLTAVRIRGALCPTSRCRFSRAARTLPICVRLRRIRRSRLPTMSLPFRRRSRKWPMH